VTAAEPASILLADRNDLLADEHARQPDERDNRRSWRADVQQAVDHANQNAHAKRYQVQFHWLALDSGQDR
jgi:hypothetical protein